jgi:hypothetical protein
VETILAGDVSFLGELSLAHRGRRLGPCININRGRLVEAGGPNPVPASSERLDRSHTPRSRRQIIDRDRHAELVSAGPESSVATDYLAVLPEWVGNGLGEAVRSAGALSCVRLNAERGAMLRFVLWWAGRLPSRPWRSSIPKSAHDSEIL